MFDLSLRARVNHLFKARSADRDAEADFSRTESVFLSIEKALKITEAEHSGLDTRMQDVLARGARSAMPPMNISLANRPTPLFKINSIEKSRSDSFGWNNFRFKSMRSSS